MARSRLRGAVLGGGSAIVLRGRALRHAGAADRRGRRRERTGIAVERGLSGSRLVPPKPEGACPPNIGPMYRASAIVTGIDMRQRPWGFAQTLREVLVKSSGDPRLKDDPRIGQLAAYTTGIRAFAIWGGSDTARQQMSVFTSLSDEQRRFVAPSATSRRASSVSARRAGSRGRTCVGSPAVRTPAKLDMIDMRQAAFEKITSGVPDIDADNGKGFRHGFTLCEPR